MNLLFANKFFYFYLFLIIHNSFSLIKEFKTNDTIRLLNFIKKFLPYNPIILEAGAFDGSDTKKMHKIWPYSIIHTFEPDPIVYKKLKKNILGIPNIFTYELALSDKTGSNYFNPSVYKNNQYASGSLLLPKEHLNFANQIQFAKPIKVNTITLDDWAKKNKINRIDFLWLDMQGFELNALMASTNILKTVKIIYTEVEFIEAYKGQYLYNDVKKFLENQGFELIAKDFKDCESENKNIKVGERWYGNAIFYKKLFN